MYQGKHALLALAMTCTATIALAQPATDYNPPTRGFSLEFGQIAEPKSFSVDLLTGSGDVDTVGGVRIGLPNSELILNSALNGDARANEAALKWGLPRLSVEELDIDWAVYGGLAHIDYDTDGEDYDYTNFVVGAGFTLVEQKLTLNVNPEIEFADDERDDTIFNFGVGAYYTLFDTEYGRFQPGAEVTLTSADEEDDTRFDLGLRWMVKENITLDFVAFHSGNDDVTSLPGFIRLNAVF